jgi:molybdopterin converting factor small subunit
MTVLFYGSVQEYTLGEKSLEVGGVQCVSALIDLLGERFGEDFKEFLLGDHTCFFLVNGNGIMTTGGLGTQLQSEDTVEVLPLVEAG